MTLSRPIGYFVHHQGRGHAERAAAIVNALPSSRPVTLFCARTDIFPPLRNGVRVLAIPSLFEPQGNEVAMDHIPTPDTLHCAPLGWPGIRRAMATLAAWFGENDPALIVSDVSAEIAQMARICSVPCVPVLQHGDRSDPGHLSAYQGAAGLLAPFDAALAQPDWPGWMRDKTFFAPGVGIDTAMPDRMTARSRIGVEPTDRMVLVVSGAGGSGFAQAPLAVGARSDPTAQWITIGEIQRDWHATEPANLRHMGWVANPVDYIAAADLVVASTGNTTCHQILAAGKPWLAVPEWRYFDEQLLKAECLDRADVAVMRPHLPSSAKAWAEALAQIAHRHDAARQQAMVIPDAARRAADWLDKLCHRLWGTAPAIIQSPKRKDQTPMSQRSVSALTIARGRPDHLTNLVLGLAQQDPLPMELLIGRMQAEPYALPDVPFPVRQIEIPGDDLPLALARNTIAFQAEAEVLAFIDVDCIPAPGLIADYADTCAPGAGLMMGEVQYLPGGATDQGIDFDRFEELAVLHPDRQGPPARRVERCTDYRCFWSLNFAMNRDDFRASGGFDERYFGYGGEDTDFGRSLVDLGIPISWIQGARIYHQYHPHHMPPVHHLESVVRNAELFASKWGYRTMEHWLYCFQLMGLIRNTPHGLEILRQPGPDDFALSAQQSDMPFATTRRVMDILNAREFPLPDEQERRRQVTRAQKSMLLPAAE